MYINNNNTRKKQQFKRGHGGWRERNWKLLEGEKQMEEVI